MIKKRLTSKYMMGYTESLKTVNTAFTPRQSVFFMPMARTRAENNQYQPKHLFTAFSESAPLSYLTAKILKKVNNMTNTLIQKIHNQYNYIYSLLDDAKEYQEEEKCFEILFAMDTAIATLPARNEEDKQIKYKFMLDKILSSGDDCSFSDDVVNTIKSLME